MVEYHVIRALRCLADELDRLTLGHPLESDQALQRVADAIRNVISHAEKANGFKPASSQEPQP